MIKHETQEAEKSAMAKRTKIKSYINLDNQPSNIFQNIWEYAIF